MNIFELQIKIHVRRAAARWMAREEKRETQRGARSLYGSPTYKMIRLYLINNNTLCLRVHLECCAAKVDINQTYSVAQDLMQTSPRLVSKECTS